MRKPMGQQNLSDIIDQQENTSNLPILDNDTNNVIEFNSGYNMDNKKKRSFWNLLNKK